MQTIQNATTLWMSDAFDAVMPVMTAPMTITDSIHGKSTSTVGVFS
jgi:hypothetical protein